jgi:hypothetical protein
MKITIKRLSPVMLVIFAIVSLALWWPTYGSQAKNFPGGLTFSNWISTMTGGRSLPAHEGGIFTPKPLPPLPKEPHPVQSNIGYAGAHGDSYNSGVMPHAGPLGDNLEVHSRITGSTFSGCSTQHFDPKHRVVTMCVGFLGSHLLLLDPSDLSILAAQALPALAGWYFRMDQQGQVIIPVGDMSLQVFRVDDSTAQPHWEQVARYDLGSVVPEAERVLKTLPMDLVADWRGNWWFGIWTPAVIGYRDSQGQIYSHHFTGEILENGVAADAEGIYFVTDKHLYGMRASNSGPEVFLKIPYDAGGGVNALSQGSGTTPVLLGDKLIAFGDNATPRPNLLVYRLDDIPAKQRLVCRIPVFKAGRGSLENSFIGYDHSIIIENNMGMAVFGDSSNGEPGITRVDVRRDLSGCDVVWENYAVRAGTGAKLSTKTGLIYVHELLFDTGPINAWYISALDFETGAVAWRHYIGSGKQWDNAMLTMSIGPNGLLTSGTFSGLISVRDADK